MSDHDEAPDPVDKAYREAEAALHDEAARAARRARVLAAVAAEAAAPAPARPPSGWRTDWGRGGWLAAATVAGLAVILSTQIHHPAPIRPQAAPLAAAGKPAAPAVATLAKPPATLAPPRSPRLAPLPPQPMPAPPAITLHETPAPPAALPPPPPPPPPPAMAMAPPAPVAAPRPAPAGPAASEPLVVTAERKAASAPDEGAAGPGGANDVAAKPRAVSPAVVVSSPAGPFRRFAATAASPADQAARLRAAAADGRIAEVQALLTKGVPVDAADEAGDTALMKSIRADHSAVAALLRRHGASLDRRNRAGLSARDMAVAVGDAQLSAAIGIGP